MRETVGHTFIIKIVVALTLLFSAFLVVAITYNKVFRLKNQVVSIIEKYEGVSSGSYSYKTINNYLSANNYSTMSKCPSGYQGVTSYSGGLEDVSSNKKYYYCIKKSVVKIKKLKENESREIYNVILFYKLNIPLFGDMTIFEIKGQTKTIIYE